MPVVMVIAPLALFALIVYFAVSKKSSPPVRKAAVIALIIAGFSLIVSAVLIFSGSAGAAVPGIEAVPDRPVQAKAVDPWYLAVFVAVFLLFLGFIVFMGQRERREREAGKAPARAGKKP
jgi:bacteriorhodopsin